MTMALTALARPYRPRPEWMDDANLVFVLAAAAVLAIAGIAAIVRAVKARKAEKHAALDRVRARVRRG